MQACAVVAAVSLMLVTAVPAVAQTPPPEPPPDPWTGAAGFGFSLNQGNTDTTNLNVTFEGTHDPKLKNVWKVQGLYLRGEVNGETSADRLFLQGRYERALTPRAFAFGQVQYLRDEFKQIDYLVAPVGGFGYKLIATETVTLTADAGAGLKLEQNPELDLQQSATITAGDRLDWKVSPMATITQGVSALWDADDFGDALYTFSAGVAASVTEVIQLKFELLDSYSTKPPNADVKKNDVALITAVVYKF